jgi:hypothetical protein
MQTPSFETIYKALKFKCYHIFEADTKPYNLNIIGVRNLNRKPNSFDDWIVVMWKYKGQWTFKSYQATTDPGLYYLWHPSSPSGTAILKEGQYLNSFKLGLHKSKYKALVQSKPLTVIRDYNRDSFLDYSSGKEETGMFGINIHSAKTSGTTMNVNQWSAGCQVFENSENYNEFISICTKAEKFCENSFSYTLLNHTDLLGFKNHF